LESIRQIISLFDGTIFEFVFPPRQIAKLLALKQECRHTGPGLICTCSKNKQTKRKTNRQEFNDDDQRETTIDYAIRTLLLFNLKIS
jgi:hypothetical protein